MTVERAVLGTALCGRVLDARGVPLDNLPAPCGRRVVIPRTAPAPHERASLHQPLWTGIRALDGLLTFVRGMRVGIFGPPGSGKSTLLDAIGSTIDADAVVIALIGERGNEIPRHLARCDARTTVICAPCDRSSAERLDAGEFALAQATALRDRGLHVAVIFDSLARYAQAARELALALDEPPGPGGYPVSVWLRLATLCERAGATACGSITLIATVLSDVFESADPLAEAARAQLDGHVMLSRRLAERGRFPAIDVPASLSRPMDRAVSQSHFESARRVRAALARLEDSREARELGLPVAESDLARAVAAEPALEGFLRQGPEPEPPEATLSQLAEIADTL